MKKIIVTADDYGMSSAVNRAINECIEAGLVTSTNVMMNMPLVEEAVALKLNYSVSVGIHFTLTCGKPVSEISAIPSLVSDSGEFHPFDEFRNRYRHKQISDEEIITELTAQYNKFIEIFGIQPDYWNTHQNVHVDFRIYKLFVNFACTHGVNRMRSHQRIYVDESVKGNRHSLIWRILEPVKSRILNSWQNNAHEKGIASPDGIIVCLNKGDINKPEYLFSNIRWSDNSVAEYVIHPATENDSPYFGKIVDQRINEYKMFTSQNTKEIINKAGIELGLFDM